MTEIFRISAIGIGVLLVVRLLLMYFDILISRRLVRAARPFSREGSDRKTTLLVLGDSTEVGVGAAKPEDSVAGRMSAYVGATYVENVAVSGARVADLPQQIARAKLSSYSYILIGIGANDIIRFRSTRSVMAGFARVLPGLPRAGQPIVHSAGNVGAATLFPPFVRPFYTWLTRAYHQAFARLAAEKGFTYVNLYQPRREDMFRKKPEIYFAGDGLHPSSEGYALWFEKIRPQISGTIAGTRS